MSRLTIPVSEKDHVQGAKDAPVTLVEYGDYECPYCGQAYPIVKKLQKNLGNKLRFIFRNFPLQEAHPHALLAACAAEAAALQGKFWEMHDLLYENQDALEPEDLLSYARDLKLNLTQFENDISEETVTQRVKADFKSGLHSGVNGTPCFFINGVRHDAPWDYDSLSAALLETIQTLA